MIVPAICDTCSTIFPSGFEMVDCTNVRFNNCTSGPCPKCSGVGHIPDGIYNFIGNTIELLSGPSKTISQLTRIAGIVEKAKSTRMSYQEVIREIDNNAPELSSLKDCLPKSRNELYAFLALIITIISLIISQNESRIVNNIEINNVINHSYQQNNIFEETTELKAENRKIGRNEQCPCNSGLKYKKCCINKK